MLDTNLDIKSSVKTFESIITKGVSAEPTNNRLYVINVIKEQLNPKKKTTGHDLIFPKMIMELPNCAVRYISTLFNAIAKNN